MTSAVSHFYFFWYETSLGDEITGMPTYMLIVYINSLKPVGDMQHNKIAYNKQLVKGVCITSLLSLTHFPAHSLLVCKWSPYITGKEAREGLTKSRTLNLWISQLSSPEAWIQAAASSNSKSTHRYYYQCTNWKGTRRRPALDGQQNEGQKTRNKAHLQEMPTSGDCLPLWLVLKLFIPNLIQKT